MVATFCNLTDDLNGEAGLLCLGKYLQALPLNARYGPKIGACLLMVFASVSN